MARKKCKGTELSVFKGREARLNRAVLQVLVSKSSQTIYDVHKQLQKTIGFKKTRYHVVNTRLRALETNGYVSKTGAKMTKAGISAALYEATTRAFFVLLLSSLSLDDLIQELDEVATITILSTIVSRE